MSRLDNASVTAVIDEIRQYLKSEGIDRKNISIVRIIAEDILLYYQGELSAEGELKYRYARKDHNVSLEFRIRGEKKDIMAGGQSEQLPLVYRLWQKLNGKVLYDYEGGENRIEIILTDKITFRGNLAFAWELAKVKKKDFVIGALLQLVSTTISIHVPLLTVDIITGLNAALVEQLLITVAMICVLRLSHNVVYRASIIHFSRVYDSALFILQSQLADAVLCTQQSVLQEQGTGFFYHRIADDAKAVSTGLNDMIVNVVDFMYYLGIAIAMIVLSPLAFGVSALNILAIYLLDQRRGRVLTAYSKKLRADEEKVSDCVDAIVHGNEEIRLFNSQPHFMHMLEERVIRRNKTAYEKTVKRQNYNMLGRDCGVIGQFLFITTLALLLKNKILIPASAIALYNFNNTITSYIVNSLTTFLDSVKEYNIACERAGMLLSSPYFPKEQFGERRLDRVRGEIRFENVSFAYNHDIITEPDQLVLRNMDLTVEAGKTTAIVGRSGYGKTTMVNLITRIRDVTDGRITLDGVDVRELDRDTLRNGISVVSQNSYYFNLSVRENLSIADPDISDDRLMEICDMVSLGDLIREMPDGLDTVIGERGVRLSGGQRQRLAIARAIVKNSPVIIFDEATSALDNITQQEVQNAISRLSGEHTVIVIAHRLSTIRDADKIVYIDGGRVLAEGPHGELWRICPPYRALYEAESNSKGENE